MRVAEAIRQARSLLQDQQAPFRYTDETLQDALRMCLATIEQARPDLFVGGYKTGQVNVTDVDLASPTFELPVPEPWVRRVPMGMAAFCELRDDEYASDGRAGALMQLFMGSLG